MGTTMRPPKPQSGYGLPTQRPTQRPSSHRPPQPAQQQRARWILAPPNQDCIAACRRDQAQWSESHFSQVNSQGVYQLSQELRSPCTMTWTNDGIHGAAFQNLPAQCLSQNCGVDPRG